jgi:enoyl-CoA hydratase/carnithine racemase
MTAENLVLTERRGPVQIVTLDRTAKRNALNDRAVQALGRVFLELPSDVRAVVLAANGDNFSAGLDLSELKERDTGEGISRALSSAEDLSLPSQLTCASPRRRRSMPCQKANAESTSVAARLCACRA